MCPLRYVLALLTALVLLYFLAALALDARSGGDGLFSAASDGGAAAAGRAAVLARARSRSCWRFTISFFTGELLYDLWRGAPSTEGEPTADLCCGGDSDAAAKDGPAAAATEGASGPVPPDDASAAITSASS